MTVPDFCAVKMLHSQNSILRHNAKVRTKKLRREFRKVVIAGVIRFTCQVLAIRSKIVNAILSIKPVERAYRKKRREFNGQLQFGCMCLQSPIVLIITVK